MPEGWDINEHPTQRGVWYAEGPWCNSPSEARGSFDELVGLRSSAATTVYTVKDMGATATLDGETLSLQVCGRAAVTVAVPRAAAHKPAENSAAALGPEPIPYGTPETLAVYRKAKDYVDANPGRMTDMGITYSVTEPGDPPAAAPVAKQSPAEMLNKSVAPGYPVSGALAEWIAAYMKAKPKGQYYKRREALLFAACRDAGMVPSEAAPCAGPSEDDRAARGHDRLVKAALTGAPQRVNEVDVEPWEKADPKASPVSAREVTGVAKPNPGGGHDDCG